MGKRVPAGLTGYGAPVVAKLAGLSYPTLNYYSISGLVRASIAEGDGKGSARLYSFLDLVALRVVVELRKTRLSLQRIRKCVEVLRDEWDESLANVKLLTDGNEVYLIRDDKTAVALLMRAGQVTWRACVDVSGAAADVRKLLAKEGQPAPAKIERVARDDRGLD